MIVSEIFLILKKGAIFNLTLLNVNNRTKLYFLLHHAGSKNIRCGQKKKILILDHLRISILKIFFLKIHTRDSKESLKKYVKKIADV